MPVERTGIGNTNIDETDGTVITKDTLKPPVSLLDPSSGIVLSESALVSLNSMDLGVQLMSNNVSIGTSELDQPLMSAGGGGVASAAPVLTADNVAGTSQAPAATSSAVNTVTMARVVTSAPTSTRQITLQTIAPGHTTNASLKRPLPNNSTQAPMVTKVIITKNPGSSQPQVVPIQLGQLQGQALSVTSLPLGMNVIPQLPAQGSLTPTKTITISSQGKQVLTPTKVINKIPISPAKTPTKITMIPVSLGKSPQRAVLAPGSSVVVSRTVNSAVSNSTGGTSVVASTRPIKPATITMSPTKVILKQSNQISKSMPINISGAPVLSSPLTQISLPGSSTGGVQQISVPGSKFHYVRLVTPTTQANTSSSVLKTAGQMIQMKSIAPATSLNSATTSQHVQIGLPASGTQPLTGKSVVNTMGGQQRLLLPAPNQVSVRPAVSTPAATTAQLQSAPTTTSTTNLTQILPQGTTFISSSGSIPGVQGFALVPAQYVNQLRQQIKPATAQQPAPAKPPSPPQAARNEFIPIASSDPFVTATAVARNVTNGNAIEPTGARPRKPCNCTKSQCLKLYCDCFANGEFCHNCNCTNCANNLEHEEGRSRAIKACLDRNPMAFHPKIGKGRVGDGDRRHNKGCNCKRSGCLKNYCECYEAKIMCSSTCKCVGCKNFEESPERKTLMHLADAAEVRVQQQTAAKSKLSSQISDLPLRPPAAATGERLPYTFVTTDVAEATCACLLAQLEEADRLKMPEVMQERMVIEEFGRCLMQIIDSANKTRDAPIISEYLGKHGKPKPSTRILKRQGGGDGS